MAHTSNIGGLLKSRIRKSEIWTCPWVAFTLHPQRHESRDPRHVRSHVLHFSAALRLRLTAHRPHMHAHACLRSSRSEELGGSFAIHSTEKALRTDRPSGGCAAQDPLTCDCERVSLSVGGWIRPLDATDVLPRAGMPINRRLDLELMRRGVERELQRLLIRRSDDTNVR